MQVRKGTPPPTVERELAVDLTRDEVLAVLVNYVKTKLGPNLRFDDIQVTGDEHDKLHSVTISGIEVVQLAWKNPQDPVVPTPPAVPQSK